MSNGINKPRQFSFIIAVQAIAVVLITWDHLVGAGLNNNLVFWLPLNLSRVYITQPLGIIQDFGFIGVSLIFLSSGFLIAHVAQQENQKEFLLKRLLRIFPPLIFSILLIVLSYWIYFFATNTQTFVQNLGITDILLSLTLTNYFMIPQNAVNGVAWILVVQLIFYLTMFCILPFIRKNLKLAIILPLLFTFLVTICSRQFGDNFFLFAVSVSYLPFLILGQITYYYYSKIFSSVKFIFYAFVTFSCAAYGLLFINSNFLALENSYLISFVYAFLGFFLIMKLSAKVSFNRFGFLSKISYSFYLNQSLALLFISVFFPLVGYEVALFLSLILLTAVAYISWRLIEVPSRKLALFFSSGKIDGKKESN